MASKIMKNFVYLFLLSLITGCSTHIVEHVYMEGVESKGWKKKQVGNSVVYQCENFSLEYSGIDLGQRNATNSVFWIAVIPTNENTEWDNDNIHIWLNYTGITSCEEISVSMIVDKTAYKPKNTDTTNRSCRFGWGFKFKDIESYILQFNPIENCNIPNLEIKKQYDYTYENHFEPW